MGSILTNTQLTAAVADLQFYLSQITAVDFTLSEEAKEESITLSLVGSAQAPADAAARLAGQGLNAFLIKRAGDKLDICANDVQGLAHGIYYYLELVGVRWLAPGDKWTIIPNAAGIAPVVDTVVAPVWKARTTFGTGGFFNLWMGRNYPVSTIIETAVTDWRRRLRQGGEYRLGGHIYQSFHLDPTIKPVIEANPTSLAIIDGAPYPFVTTANHTTAKINAGNPTAVARFTTWLVGQMAKNRLSTDKSRHNLISCDPSDGGAWGNNTADLVAAGVGDGSPTDQAWHIANAAAVAVAAAYPGSRVQQLAYNQHATVPSFPIEDNILVQVTPYAFTGGLNPETLINEWSAVTGQMALYDYWSIPDWAFEEPRFNFLTIAERIRYWSGKGFEALNAESSSGTGAMGIGHYVASHQYWNPDADEETLIDEWFDLAFGAGATAMRTMMERWATRFLLISVELGQSYANINTALAAASGDADATARILDFGRYLHYLRLRKDYAHTPSQTTADALAKYLLEISDTFMVQGTRLLDLMANTYPSLRTTYAVTSGANWATGSGWVLLDPPDDADVAALMTAGAVAYPPGDFTVQSYEGGLVPLAPIGAWTDPGDVWGNVFPTIGSPTAFVYVREGMTSIPLKINRQVDNIIRATRVATGEVVYYLELPKLTLSDWIELDIAEDLEAGELIQLSFEPTGGRATGYFRIQTKPGTPLNFTAFLAPKTTITLMPRLYFYVPVGATKIVFYYPGGSLHSAMGGHKYYNPAGTQVAMTEYRDANRVAVMNVPGGQDDAIWSMAQVVSPDDHIRMLTTPQTFALEPSLLLVPSDA